MCTTLNKVLLEYIIIQRQSQFKLVNTKSLNFFETKSRLFAWTKPPRPSWIPKNIIKFYYIDVQSNECFLIFVKMIISILIVQL